LDGKPPWLSGPSGRFGIERGCGLGTVDIGAVVIPRGVVPPVGVWSGNVRRGRIAVGSLQLTPSTTCADAFISVSGGVVAGGDTGQLSGWVDGPLAIDIQRATRLTQQGYRIWTHTLPAEITAKNRLLLGAPLLVSPGEAS